MVLNINCVLLQYLIVLENCGYASFSVQYMFFGTALASFAGTPSLAKLLLRTLSAYS